MTARAGRGSPFGIAAKLRSMPGVDRAMILSGSCTAGSGR